MAAQIMRTSFAELEELNEKAVPVPLPSQLLRPAHDKLHHGNVDASCSNVSSSCTSFAITQDGCLVTGTSDGLIGFAAPPPSSTQRGTHEDGRKERFYSWYASDMDCSELMVRNRAADGESVHALNSNHHCERINNNAGPANSGAGVNDSSSSHGECSIDVLSSCEFSEPGTVLVACLLQKSRVVFLRRVSAMGGNAPWSQGASDRSVESTLTPHAAHQSGWTVENDILLVLDGEAGCAREACGDVDGSGAAVHDGRPQLPIPSAHPSAWKAGGQNENGVNEHEEVERTTESNKTGKREVFTYSSSHAAHGWLDSKTFIVGCSNGAVVTVSASAGVRREAGRALHVVHREDSCVTQLNWHPVTSTLVVSSLKRSVALLMPNRTADSDSDGEVQVHVIGSKPREEGYYGACLATPSHSKHPQTDTNCGGEANADEWYVYAARHNGRVFEATAADGTVRRTYRTPKVVPLGLLHPIDTRIAPNVANATSAVPDEKGGQDDEVWVMLWSQGDSFICVVELSNEPTCRFLRYFKDGAQVVRSTQYGANIFVLLSNSALLRIMLTEVSEPHAVNPPAPLTLKEMIVASTQGEMEDAHPVPVAAVEVHKHTPHKHAEKESATPSIPFDEVPISETPQPITLEAPVKHRKTKVVKKVVRRKVLRKRIDKNDGSRELSPDHCGDEHEKEEAEASAGTSPVEEEPKNFADAAKPESSDHAPEADGHDTAAEKQRIQSIASSTEHFADSYDDSITSTAAKVHEESDAPPPHPNTDAEKGLGDGVEAAEKDHRSAADAGELGNTNNTISGGLTAALVQQDEEDQATQTEDPSSDPAKGEHVNEDQTPEVVHNATEEEPEDIAKHHHHHHRNQSNHDESAQVQDADVSPETLAPPKEVEGGSGSVGGDDAPGILQVQTEEPPGIQLREDPVPPTPTPSDNSASSKPLTPRSPRQSRQSYNHLAWQSGSENGSPPHEAAEQRIRYAYRVYSARFLIKKDHPTLFSNVVELLPDIDVWLRSTTAENHQPDLDETIDDPRGSFRSSTVIRKKEGFDYWNSAYAQRRSTARSEEVLLQSIETMLASCFEWVAVYPPPLGVINAISQRKKLDASQSPNTIQDGLDETTIHRRAVIATMYNLFMMIPSVTPQTKVQLCERLVKLFGFDAGFSGLLVHIAADGLRWLSLDEERRPPALLPRLSPLGDLCAEVQQCRPALLSLLKDSEAFAQQSSDGILPDGFTEAERLLLDTQPQRQLLGVGSGSGSPLSRGSSGSDGWVDVGSSASMRRQHELNVEKCILKQSVDVLEAFEEHPLPMCAAIYYFPYLFAVMPSKGFALATSNYPGFSISYLEWALVSVVQGAAVAALQGKGCQVERLPFEDLADSLADLVLLLLQVEGEVVRHNTMEYTLAVKVLLQRRFTIRKGCMEAHQQVYRMSEVTKKAWRSSYIVTSGKSPLDREMATLSREGSSRSLGGSRTSAPQAGSTAGKQSTRSSNSSHHAENQPRSRTTSSTSMDPTASSSDGVYRGSVNMYSDSGNDRTALTSNLGVSAFVQRKLRRLEESLLALLSAPPAVRMPLNTLLDLLDEYEFPEGVFATDLTDSFIDRCVREHRMERLLLLFQTTNSPHEAMWMKLFSVAHEEQQLEAAMFVCLTVEKHPKRVRYFLRRTFPMLDSPTYSDDQLQQVGNKLKMLLGESVAPVANGSVSQRK